MMMLLRTTRIGVRVAQQAGKARRSLSSGNAAALTGANTAAVDQRVAAVRLQQLHKARRTFALSSVVRTHDSSTAAAAAAAKQGKQALNPGNQLRGTYAIVFTCNKCGHRSSKSFSKHAYHKGVVLVECESCKVRHLIADNLDWFQGLGGGKNVEEILKEKGQDVKRQGKSGVMEITAADQQLVNKAKEQHSEAARRPSNQSSDDATN